MPQFLKMFLAALLALVVFGVLGFFVLMGMAGALASGAKPEIRNKSILVLDLSKHYREQKQDDPMALLTSGETATPGLYDVVRLLQTAKTDERISGLYILAESNANSYAASSELRNAVLDFKASKKPVVAYADVMSQSAYFVASAAGKVYLNPAGNFDWSGFNVDFVFLKGLLDKLDIQPQVFYAGKFKSATETFRTTEMTPENEQQTKEWLGDLYNHFLVQIAAARRTDTARLQQLANNAAVQTPQDALQQKLVDALKYDDQVKDEWKQYLKQGKYDKLNFLAMSTYAEAANFRSSGKGRIAVVFAEGNIVDGEGSGENIGGDRFRNLLRKARLDKSVKAIVLRVNSGGGSALASENIWRELELAKQEKPVVVSMGDLAASGGYYIGCGADSIFAHANTLTGSIGVFALVPNMKDFFGNKLGVTFDGVKTSEYAGAGAPYRPLEEKEKALIQRSVDRIYLQFKERVAKGRKKDLAYIDSLAQGRVWSGEDAVRLGLADKLGGLQDAVSCAARMAKLDTYRIREYPEQQDLLNRLLNRDQPSDPAVLVKEQIGAQNYEVYQQLVAIQQMCGPVQARLPFTFIAR